MRVVRIAAVVLAILGGMFALLGYASVVKDDGGADAALGYVWILFTGVLAVIGGVLAALWHPEDGSSREKTFRGYKRRSEEGWIFCPECGTRLSPSDEIAPDDHGCERREERRASRYYEPDSRILGRSLFWLGVVVLDALFVLFVLWLFVPSLVLSQKIFLSMGRPFGIVVLDAGIGCLLLSYALTPSSAIRL